MSWILSAILPEVLALLQYFIKNPSSLAKEKVILTEIDTLIQGILKQLP